MPFHCAGCQLLGSRSLVGSAAVPVYDQTVPVLSLNCLGGEAALESAGAAAGVGAVVESSGCGGALCACDRANDGEKLSGAAGGALGTIGALAGGCGPLGCGLEGILAIEALLNAFVCKSGGNVFRTLVEDVTGVVTY